MDEDRYDTAMEDICRLSDDLPFQHEVERDLWSNLMKE